jgi:hypothetical protein
VTPFQGPTAFFDLSSELLLALNDVLASTPPGKAKRACVVPGNFAWDECECNTLAVVVRRWFLSDDFPTGAFGRGQIRSTPCNLPWLVGELGVIVLRCAPQPQGQDLAPTCAKLSDAANVYVGDAYTVLTETINVMCDWVATDRVVDYVLGDQEARGPEGMCVGTELTVSVAINR